MFGDSAPKTTFYNDENVFSGGGFGGTQIGGGMSGASPTKKPAVAAPRSEQTLIPLTIQQIVEAELPSEDSAFMVDGVELNNVKVVAQVEELRSGATNTEVTLTDESMLTVKVKVWSYDGAGDHSLVDEKLAEIAKGDWIRVSGRVQIYKDQKNLNAFHITKVSELEMRHHKIEARYVHLLNTKTKKAGATSAFGSVAEPGSSTAAHGLGASDMGMDVDDETRTPFEKRVLELVKRMAQSATGASVDFIHKHMSDKNVGDIRETLEAMVSNGTVFSTVDEEHFKPTDADL